MSAETNKTVPYFVVEGEMARMERTNHRLWILCILLLAVLLGTNAGRRGYSRDDYSGDDKMSMLEEMMENASDPREREMIQKMMDQYR